MPPVKCTIQPGLLPTDLHVFSPKERKPLLISIPKPGDLFQEGINSFYLLSD